VSQENVEIVRRGFEGFVASGEVVRELTDPEIVVRDHDIMDAGEYRGHAGVMRWLGDWASAWSEFSMKPVEYRDAGSRVVVVLRLRATGAKSGIEVVREDAMVQTVRDGKVARIDYYNSKDQALKAVGLEE
jgi:ketosteroid isomerase-like protein